MNKLEWLSFKPLSGIHFVLTVSSGNGILATTTFQTPFGNSLRSDHPGPEALQGEEHVSNPFREFTSF